MIKRITHTALAWIAAAALLVSCVEDELWQNQQPPRDGYIALSFSADIPEMEEVRNVMTRSVDPDGGGVQDMTLFCFDSYGLFISTAKATITTNDVTSGTFKADVPDNTRTIHFLANQNMDEFKENDFRNKSEAEVMAVLEGSSGRMIYWSRFACEKDNDSNIAEQMATSGNNIRMIRNHAKISVANPQNEHIVITGFVACNTNAFGTVAPFHPTKGFDFVWPSDNDPFVTLPVNEAKMSDISDVTSNMGQYVFESRNSSDDPVSVILRGHLPNQTEEKYYRVLLIDGEGEQLLVRRNHDYQLNISGALSYGQNSFAEALEAAATNNVWISISDAVNEVEDKDYILTVEKTAVVLGEEATENGGSYTLSYTLKGKNGKTITAADAPTVSWIDNGVASQTIDPTFTVDEDGVGQGQIQIHLLPLGGNIKQEGTLLVKKGRLQRKIKVITVKKQSFIPTWVASQVYGGMNTTDPTQGRSHVTVMFTVPETCPEELFPMRVLISANDVDIRNESGMQLTVVREGENEEYYGDHTDIGYKYLYMVEKAGVQRVYFENILNQGANKTVPVSIEAEHFEKIEKDVIYSASRNSITVEGLKAYNATGGGSEGFAEDELILYRLVPQKKNAFVQFDLQLRQKTGDEINDDLDGNPFNAGENDEFLLYSQYLSDYKTEAEAPAGTVFDCNFFPTEADAWWQQNNPEGGRMLMFKPINPTNPNKGTGKYTIYMHTNRAKSAEVVRIASNQQGLPAVYDKSMYTGNSYRSVTFELANYNPFRFAARINGEGTDPTVPDPTVEVPEVVTPLTWTYEPEQKVEIAFDITSFTGTDGNSVDPFGEEFEIYIDAPMLKLGSNPGLDGKLYEATPGHFVYKVDADRAQERTYFNGERKTLNFVTSSIVSAGDIVISSNEDKVVYFAKTFSVTNSSIVGSLLYKDSEGTTHSVPKDKFVSFERTKNHSRIGSMAVPADGNYELRLRKEYSFNWNLDEVELHYTDDNGKVYHKTFNSLDELFKNKDVIVLEPAN